VATEGKFIPDTVEFEKEVMTRVYATTRELESSFGGFDFAHVIVQYYHATLKDDEYKKSCCVRWLRGEYSTKLQAKKDLGVGDIIDDDNWFEYIKLFAQLARKIGYSGFLVCLDECVNLYKLTNRISRENNYEKLLSMFNDSLGGRSSGLVLFFGGTPQFLEDGRRGLFSYEALRSRLAEGKYASDEKYRNLMGPVIKIRMMSQAEQLALIYRVSILYEQYHSVSKPMLTDTEKQIFLEKIMTKAGADTNVTPREIIREFLSLLDILLQNPETNFSEIVGEAVEKVLGSASNNGITSSANHTGIDDDDFADIVV